MKLMIQWAITSSVLILIVLAARFLLRDRLSARLKYALWGVVLLRLLVPFQVELPAPVSDALPVLASNLAPEVGQWEEPSIPVFPERSKPVAEFNLDIETTLEPGDILSYSDAVGCLRRDGETITWYRYILSPEQIVLALWLAGVGLTGAVMLVSNLRFYGRLRKRRERLEGVDAPIPVYTAAGLSSPCLFGVIRPSVYLTPEAAENPDTLRHTLAHELTHCAHFDHLWSALRCLALALHWYNPLVWLAVILSKQDGELACDEGAVARLGEGERIPYGRTLVNLVAARSLRPGDLLSCSTAMTGGEKSVKARVLALVKKPETVKTALFAVIAVITLASVFVFGGRNSAQAYSEELTAFLDQVRDVRSISVGNPLTSSQFSTSAISDPEALDQARDILSKVRPVFREGDDWRVMSLDSSKPSVPISQEELERQCLIGGHPLVLYPTADRDLETAHRYWLIRTGDDTLLARWDLEREENSVEALAALPSDTISRLKKLGGAYVPDGTDYSGINGEPYLRALTEEEVARVNEAFEPFVQLADNVYGSSEICCFFTSNYDNPAQINLEEFLRYCPIGLSNSLGEEDTEEFLAVMELDNGLIDPDRELSSPIDLPVPVHRYPRAEVSALLQKYAGVAVEELDWEGCLYLEKYDAFYNFTSDAGPGFFPCAGGEVSGDTAVLWSDPDEKGDRCRLTLQKNGDRWLFQS
ncbi:MAG: M56 family metallopeptidase, partial [Lawsonibacter sp.]|nr:M56 family metallopeptidase [Lawsonibacter sp.]